MPFRVEENTSHGRLRRFYERHSNLFAYTLFSVFFVISLGVSNYQSNQASDEIAAQAASTNRALCEFRAGLQKRYDDGVVFLKDHPDGFAGISTTQIQITLDSQKKSLDSLKFLEC